TTQAVELFAARPAGSVPEAPVGFRRIDADQPRVADALGEWIGAAVESFALLPGREVAFEGPRVGGVVRAVIVITRHREARQSFSLEKLRGAALFRREAQSRGVARENHAVKVARRQFGRQSF